MWAGTIVLHAELGAVACYVSKVRTFWVLPKRNVVGNQNWARVAQNAIACIPQSSLVYWGHINFGNGTWAIATSVTVLNNTHKLHWVPISHPSIRHDHSAAIVQAVRCIKARKVVLGIPQPYRAFRLDIGCSDSNLDLHDNRVFFSKATEYVEHLTAEHEMVAEIRQVNFTFDPTQKHAKFLVDAIVV